MNLIPVSRPTVAATPSVERKNWCAVPMPDVYAQDRAEGAPTSARGSLMSLVFGQGLGDARTDLEWNMLKHGVTQPTAFRTVRDLREQQRGSQIKAALCVLGAGIGMAVVGWQGLELVNHIVTPGTGSLLNATLGNTLKAAMTVLAGAGGATISLSLWAAKRSDAARAGEMANQVESLAKAVVAPPLAAVNNDWQFVDRLSGR